MKFTYGQEIEFIDADRRQIILPSYASFNKKEITLVNSNGVAVNSRPDSNHFLGGEINTAPASFAGAVEQADTIFKILKLHGAAINYRCNYQVHIGIPEMKAAPEAEQVAFLRRLQKFVFENAERIILLTMGDMQFIRPATAPDAYWKHTIERPLVTHKHLALMQAETLEGIRKAFFVTSTGRHHFANIQRQFINLHTWFKYGTIEFRHFWATLDSYEAQSCLGFAGDLIKQVLSGAPDRKFMDDYWPDFFPEYLPFDLELERGFQRTRVK